MKQFTTALMLVALTLSITGGFLWLNTEEEVNIISEPVVADSLLTDSLVADSGMVKINNIIERVK